MKKKRKQPLVHPYFLCSQLIILSTSYIFSPLHHICLCFCSGVKHFLPDLSGHPPSSPFLNSVVQSVVPKPTLSTSPENFSEMRILGPTSQNQKLLVWKLTQYMNKHFRQNRCLLKSRTFPLFLYFPPNLHFGQCYRPEWTSQNSSIIMSLHCLKFFNCSDCFQDK